MSEQERFRLSEVNGPEVASRLRKALKGTSRREVIAQSGVSKMTVARALSGKAVRITTLTALAEALDVNADWLIYGVGEMKTAAVAPPPPPPPPPATASSMPDPGPEKPNGAIAPSDVLEALGLGLVQLARLVRWEEDAPRRAANLEAVKDAIFGPLRRNARGSSSSPENPDTSPPSSGPQRPAS